MSKKTFVQVIGSTTEGIRFNEITGMEYRINRYIPVHVLVNGIPLEKGSIFTFSKKSSNGSWTCSATIGDVRGVENRILPNGDEEYRVFFELKDHPTRLLKDCFLYRMKNLLFGYREDKGIDVKSLDIPSNILERKEYSIQSDDAMISG